MASLCKNHFLQQLYRKIDGAVLRSQNEPNLDCVITFQTETILQRFMLRFDQLQLDCNDHLLIYDGAHPIGNYKVTFSLLSFSNFSDHLLRRIRRKNAVLLVLVCKLRRSSSYTTVPGSWIAEMIKKKLIKTWLAKYSISRIIMIRM